MARYKQKEHDPGIAFVSGNQPRFDGNTFSVRTEPGVQAQKLPEPIALLGTANPYVDVRYDGDMNIADNTVDVAAMDQGGSEWRKFDCVDMKLSFNYLGLGMTDTDRNRAYNMQFRITQQDAISAAYASQLTELEFMALMIQSSIPEMEGFNEGKYTGSGQFAYLIWYQTFMQNIAAVMGKYNTLLSYADYLVKMGYNAEAHMTVRLINILKKQNVWTLFDQTGNLLQTEFFDLDFYKEITVLNTVPCRQRNGVDSPLLSLTGVVKMPDIAVFPKTDEAEAQFSLFDSENLKANVQAYLLSSAPLPDILTVRLSQTYQAIAEEIVVNGTTITEADKDEAIRRAKVMDVMVNNYSNIPVKKGNTFEYYDIEGLFAHVMDLMSFPSILKWARNAYFHPDASDADPAKSYANRLISSMISLVNAVSHFRSDTSDLVTFLRVLQNSTSMNNWVLDVPYLHPSLPRAQAEPQYFKLVYDILTSYGTSGSMKKDENTRGWAISTWWHADEGIPKYDAYDGGLAIAASVRGVPTESGATYREPEYMLPILFEVPENGIRFLNRRGFELTLKQTEFTSLTINSSNIFASCKLMELPTSIQVPTLDFRNITTGDSIGTVDFSQAARVLGLLFGVGRVWTTSGDINDFLDPRMEGFIGREFMNCNTRALTYINCRAPFRVTPGFATMGFSVR